jgi:hypothetical protein
VPVMVNIKKLADRAKLAKTLVDQQGGTEGIKQKVERLRDVAKSPGTVGQRAKAAASVAREKPTPKRGADANGPDRSSDN